MPVNAGRTGALHAANLEDERGRQLGVLLVLLVVLDDPQLVADMLGRPVTLLTGFPRRAQIVQRRRDGPRIEIEGNGNQLPGAIEFRFDEPVGARADVAVRAGDARMRRARMRRVLWLHHRVAGGPAELDGFHHVDALVGRARDDDDVEDRGAEEDQHPAARRRQVEVEYGQQGNILAARQIVQLASPEYDADGNQDQAEDEEHRQDQVGQDAEIRSTLETPELHPEQRHDQNQRRQRYRRAHQADRIARQRCKKVTEHTIPLIVWSV